MASEEERAAILAEYKAALQDDGDDFEDDEADFDPANYGSSEEDDDDYSGDDGEEEGTSDYCVLTGQIHLNEEGRVIYAGTWCMRSQLDIEKESGKVTKHPKFKLKSQEVCHPPSSSMGDDNPDSNGKLLKVGALFDVRRPTLSKLPSGDADGDITASSLPTRRAMVFDGFFVEPTPASASSEQGEATAAKPEENGKHHHHHQHGKKVKERDVELFFIMENKDGGDVIYRISGRGYNDYGPFVLDGTYNATPPTAKPDKPDNGKGEEEGKHHHHHGHKHHRVVGLTASVVCNKTYGSGGSTKDEEGATRSGSRRSRRCNNADDDSFDEDFDEKADYGEVSELYEDATMSVEELRRKYYGGGGGGGGDDEGGDDEEEDIGDGGGKMSPAKRPRLDESDDDECGF